MILCYWMFLKFFFIPLLSNGVEENDGKNLKLLKTTISANNTIAFELVNDSDSVIYLQNRKMDIFLVDSTVWNFFLPLRSCQVCPFYLYGPDKVSICQLNPGEVFVVSSGSVKFPFNVDTVNVYYYFDYLTKSNEGDLFNGVTYNQLEKKIYSNKVNIDSFYDKLTFVKRAEGNWYLLEK